MKCQILSSYKMNRIDMMSNILLIDYTYKSMMNPYENRVIQVQQQIIKYLT